MWLFDGRLFDPQAVIVAQLVVEALLVVMVGMLLWRRPGRPEERPGAAEGTMAATENLLRRLDEKRRAVESAVETVRAKTEQGAVPRYAAGGRHEPKAGRQGGLERAASLAARGLTSAEIARELGLPRAEVEMFLSLREGAAGEP